MKPKIKITGLHKSFGNKKVLEGVDLEINEGESLVVIGGSGSGKSVLIKNIIGLMHPDSGNIIIDDEEVSRFKGKDRDKVMEKFGMLFQGGALFDSLPVWLNIVFGLLHDNKNSKSRNELRDIAMKRLASVGLGAEVADLYPSELSGGMQKRVSLARAIARDPKIILFDEPTTGLDPIMADVINELIIKCSQELGATTISITHDMASVRKIANKVAMIYQGKIIWHGRKEDIDNTNNPYVDQFIHGRADGPIKMQIQDH